MTIQRNLYLLLALLCFVIPDSAAAQYYVRPAASVNCPTEPCLSLGEYVSSVSDYFTSNTSFIFLEGDHHLKVSVALRDITNMTLSGRNTGSRIIVSEAGISWIGSASIVLNWLRFEYYGTHVPGPLLLFNSSASVITNVQFSRFSNMPLNFSAISYIQSEGLIARSSFSYGQSLNGSAIYMDSSTVSFSDVTFRNNTASLYGGAIYANRSFRFTHVASWFFVMLWDTLAIFVRPVGRGIMTHSFVTYWAKKKMLFFVTCSFLDL